MAGAAHAIGARPIRIYETVRLWNLADEARVRSGKKKPLVEEALVDAGATTVAIPGRVADALRLERDGTVKVRYADMRRARRTKALGLRLEVLGRSLECSPIIEPRRDTILLGLIVLEELDLVVDARRKRLVPNPDSPDQPTLDMF